jgi:peptidylprolyl isomerase
VGFTKGIYTELVKKLSGNSLTLTAAVVMAAAAMTLAGTAQAQASGTGTGTGAAKSSTATSSTATHKAGAATGSTLPKNIPPVKGIPRTLYALKYIDIKVGTGEVAPATGVFTVHYTGWLESNGTKFDSSVDRKEPIKFQVGARRVIPGWDTGFAGMRVGGKRRLFIPYQLAYGDLGRPPVIPAKANLIFDVELVAVEAAPARPMPGVPGSAAPGGARQQGAPPTGAGSGSGAGSSTGAASTAAAGSGSSDGQPANGKPVPPPPPPPSGAAPHATPQAAPQGTGPSAKIPPTFDK